MTDTVVSFAPNGAAPFAVNARYRWEDCDEPGYEGFRAEIRVNLTNGERRAFVRRLDEILAYSAAWLTAPDAERDQDDTPARQQWALIAPYVRAWNAVWLDEETGEAMDIPAPAVGGPDVLDQIDDPMRDWLVLAIVGGYRGGKGVPAWSAWRRAAAEPSGPRIVPDAPVDA